MGWLTRKVPVEAKDTSSLLRMFGGSTPDPEYPASTFLNHVEQGYDKSELVFSCIKEKATSLPEGTLRVYDSLGRRGEPLQDHPLRRLLANPNPLMSEFELFEVVATHLDLAGNAFWEVVRDRSERPVELWPVRPDRIRMKRARNKVDYGYAVDSARTVPIEVVHFKLPNPVDPLVGGAPMRAALRATALDNEATDFVKALLQNHAIPGIVVKMAQIEAVLDQEVTDRLKAKWKASYGGKNRGEPAFLQTGMDVQELGLNLKDLEFPDLRTISESRICMSFGVPPIIVGAKVGLDRSTFANYAEARKAFWEQTLMPLQRRMRDTIAQQLLPLVPAGGRGTRGLASVSLRWDNSEVLALKESEQERWERATRAFQVGGLTVNDYRRELGLPEVTSGDIFLMPSGVIATRDMAGAVQQVNGQPSGSNDGEPGKAAPIVIENKASDRVREQQVVKHAKALRSYFTDRRADVRSQITGKAVGIDEQRWTAELADILYKLGISASTAAGMSVSDLYDEIRTQGWHWSRATNSAKAINAKLIEEALAALVAAEPAEAVAELFDEYEGTKADRMATTMTTEAVAWGAVEAGRQAILADRDKTAVKKWVVRSGNARPSHARMGGQVVGIDEKFSNGMKWPGDPSGGVDEVAGCTCDVEITIE